jgi:hypothetical protein
LELSLVINSFTHAVVDAFFLELRRVNRALRGLKPILAVVGLGTV